MSWVAVAVAGGTALVGAYSANRQASAARDASRQSNQPQWNQTVPWDRTQGDISTILEGIRGQYASGIPQMPTQRGGKPSAQTNEAMEYLRGRALGGDQLTGSASDWLQGSLSDPYGGNAITGEVMGNLRGGSPWEGMLANFASQDPTRGYTPGAGYQQPPAGYTPGLGYDARTGGPAEGGANPRESAARSRLSGFLSMPRPAQPSGQGLVPENLRHFFEDWEGVPPETQALLDIMQRESAEDEARAVADFEARAEGAGRLGSGAWAAGRGAVAEQLAQERESGRAGLLAGDLNERRQAALAALGLLNDRDMAEMSNATAMAAAGGAAGNARYTADLEHQAAMRGMDIQEMLGSRGLDLQELLGMREQNLAGVTAGLDNSYRNNALMAGLSGDLNALRMGSMGAVPGLTEASYAGLDRYLPGLQRQDANSAAAANRNAMIQYQNQLLPRQNLDEYMERILALNDRFASTQGTYGNPITSYMGPSTRDATIMGAIGGFLQGGGANLLSSGQTTAGAPASSSRLGSGFETGSAATDLYGR